ncbi:MAG: TonB-dependent receptor domain-containing protein, partial [Holophagaceae bacterium]
SIQEFQIVTNGFSAEYGRAAGGTLNVITKSGGNDYQGSAFYFGRRARFDSKLPISAANSSTSQNQYGFSVSGPIVKDQLFYFVSVEKLDKDDAANVAFSSNATTNAAIIAAVAAKGFTITSGSSPYKEASTSNLVKFDYLLSSDQRLSVRYSHTEEFNGKQLDFGGQTDRSAGGARDITDDTFSLNHQWTSTNWVNEFRYMYSMRDHSLLSLDTANTPYVSIIGVATFGSHRFLPQLRTEKSRQVADTFSFFTKNHAFKIGFDVLETQIKGQLPLQFGGIYRFGGFPASSGIPYTDGLTAFNNNAPLVFAQNFGMSQNSPEVSYVSTFIQDDWEVTKDFTLKLGLRYDREGLPDFLSKSTGQVPAAYTALATPDYTTSLGANIGPVRIAKTLQQYNFDKNLTASVTNSSSRVSPRLSFSWQAASDLRLYGGYGVFSGRTQIGPLAALSISNGTDMRTYILQGIPAFAVFSNALGNTNRRFQVEPTASPLTGIFPSLLLPGKINMSRSIQANAGAEYNYSNTLKLTLDLVHSNGDGFLQVRDANPTVLNPYANFAAANSSTNPWVRRPDVRYGSVFLYDSSGSSSYNAATLGLNWRPQSNFALNANYTFSRAMDNYIDWLTDYYPNNPYDLAGEQGPSNQDQRHRFNLTMIYSKDTWTFSMIGKMFSGRPWNVFAGADLNNNGDGGAGDRPAGVGRNSEYLPSSHNIDLRVAKSFALKGKQKFELMVDVFNVTNHYTVTRVQNVAAITSTFGQPIAQSYDFRRQFQFGARFSW